MIIMEKAKKKNTHTKHLKGENKKDFSIPKAIKDVNVDAIIFLCHDTPFLLRDGMKENVHDVGRFRLILVALV